MLRHCNIVTTSEFTTRVPRHALTLTGNATYVPPLGTAQSQARNSHLVSPIQSPRNASCELFMRLPPATLAQHSRLLGLAVVAMIAGFSSLASAEPIDVELADGTIVTGEVDAQTDADRLWLRREETGIVLCSGYSWDEVQALYRGQNRIVGTEIPKSIGDLKSPAKSVLDITPAISPEATARLTPANLPVTNTRPRIESLHIEAQLARWGRTAANDGLRVFVFPLSADGQLVPVRGQLGLSLFAEIVNARGGEYTVLRPDFRELESTSELVRISDFANGPAVFQLPFRRFHPDVDFDFAPGAVVHARLGIAGQGVFEASADCVPTRNFSPIRDQLQLYQGQRFFPGEHVYLRPQ